jgi:hypothetical protein
LDDTLFRPDLPQGATLADLTSDGRGRLAIKGGEFAVNQHMTDLVDKARNEIRPARWWVLGVNGVILGVVLALLMWRKVRSRYAGNERET